MSVSNLQLVSASNNSVRLTYAGSAPAGAIQWQAVNAGMNGALSVTPMTGFATASGSVASTSNIPSQLLANLSAMRVVVDDDTNLNADASDSTPPQTVQYTFSSTPTTIPILSAAPGSVSEGVNAEFKVDVRNLMGMIPNQWRVVPSLSSSVGAADFASGLLPQGGLSYVDGVASVQVTATADSIPELTESYQFQIGTGNGTSFFTVAAATVNVTDPAGTPPPLVARGSDFQGNQVFIDFSGPVHVNGSATPTADQINALTQSILIESGVPQDGNSFQSSGPTVPITQITGFGSASQLLSAGCRFNPTSASSASLGGSLP